MLTVIHWAIIDFNHRESSFCDDYSGRMPPFPITNRGEKQGLRLSPRGRQVNPCFVDPFF
ncbi:hypothetical protein HM1_0010 [Heliomicrobium modesticaldum Ice1]|uniref:Uncharacterized protein n=1 Tax=Heliobacterium modesticaldum (strain ATCC 51547 / Ice1) TaxID=498761 RepID=B0THW2_HELMI|nr:hypothetical protein HM1_0010 [Heliomicrobium modesticaldum Ice1]